MGSEGVPIGVAGVCHANATCRLAALADAKLAVAAKNHGKAQLIEDRAELGMSVLGTSAVETCPLFSIRACESKAPAPTHAPSWKLAPALAPGPAAIIGRAGACTRVPSTLRWWRGAASRSRCAGCVASERTVRKLAFQPENADNKHKIICCTIFQAHLPKCCLHVAQRSWPHR